MNRLLDDFFIYPPESRAESYWGEYEDYYEVDFNLAGFKKEDISVTVDNNILKISAKQERREYAKSLPLPKKADIKAASLVYENGLLNIKVNKRESAKSIELQIE
jgi:HSP20 family molecular chaperone IbpA